MKFKTREEQRQHATNKQMTSVGLEAHLRNLVREILAGDTSLLTEFQQSVQYAPPEMRERVRKLLPFPMSV